MIAKTEAIPIRIATFGSTSHIVTWLTPDYGKISTVIKGAQRPKRIGGGQYDIGYLCELLFYERENNGLHIFKDCTALENRRSMRGQWRKTAALSYLCLLAGSGALPAMQSPILYTQLLLGIRSIEASAPLLHLMIWYELQVLALHGTAPQLHQCIRCQAPPSKPYLLGQHAGGLICQACNSVRPFETDTLSEQTLVLLQQLQRLARPIPKTHSHASMPLPEDCSSPMGRLVSTWLDIQPRARTVAFQMAELHLQPRKSR